MLSSGVYTTFDVPGSSQTWASGINNTGQVVGYTSDKLGGFVLRNGQYTRLVVPGSFNSAATGINDAGQIAGVFHDDRGGHAFVATPSVELIKLDP